MNKNPIFIVGVQRSGTTLLRLILNAHSEIAIPEEARFLSPILSKDCANKIYTGNELQNLIQYLRKNSQFALWNFDTTDFFNQLEACEEISVKDLISLMYTSYCNKEGKQIWGDKSLFFGSIEILHELFPDARFIHIVRDGRDIFDSWRKMDKTKSNPAVMALDWTYKEKSINNAFTHIPANKQLTLRYEDLLKNPQEAVTLVCDFLDIPYEDTLLEFYKSSDKYIGKHHSELIFRKIDNQNTMKWKKTLNSRELAIFTSLARPLLEKYDYETKGIYPTFANRISLALMLIFGLPFRIGQVLINKTRYSRALKSGTDVEGLAIGKMPGKLQ